MPAKKEKNKETLGNALVNSKKKSKRKDGNQSKSKYDFEDSPHRAPDKLQSNTKENPLNDFIAEASLQSSKFEMVRGPFRIVDRSQITSDDFNLIHKTPEQIEKEIELQDRLKVPRKPPLTEDYLEKEKEEFVNWRIGLSAFETMNDVVLSPFEKNIEVWKELWRVLERSQVVIYIVDARDPLCFICQDFFDYLNEIELSFILCFNKSDLVPPPIRKEWALFFQKFKVDFVSNVQCDNDILTPTQLVEKAKLISKPGIDGKITIGFIGFPNVGKSSLMNSVVGKNIVKSSSTPGKTKHLQTFNIPELGVTLCDCPGLVFPSFQQNAPSMLCNGILNIDQMADYRSPMLIICSKIPSSVFNLVYNLKITSEFTSPNILLGLVAKQKFGNPEEIARAAKIILKDYVGGKLIHCELPPGVHFEEKQKTIDDIVKLEEEIAETSSTVAKPCPQKTFSNSRPTRGKRGFVRIVSFE